MIPRNEAINGWFMPEFSDTDVATIMLKSSFKALDYMIVVSAYFDINDRNVVPGKLRYLVESVKRNQTKVLICADSNSHSTLWGSTDDNPRGGKLNEFIFANNIVVSSSDFEIRIRVRSRYIFWRQKQNNNVKYLCENFYRCKDV